MAVPCTKYKERTVDNTAYDLAMRFGIEAQKHFPDSYVYLFGSHAKGNPGPYSDIDVAVIIGHIEGHNRRPILVLEADNVIFGIGITDFAPVEAHLIQADVDDTGFLQTILNTGIQLLEPANPFKCLIAKFKRWLWSLSPQSTEAAIYKRSWLELSDFVALGKAINAGHFD